MKDQGWPRIIDEAYRGDPFVKLVECNGKYYLFDEAALIEQQEEMYRTWKVKP